MKQYTVEIEVHIYPIELALFELTLLRMFIDRWCYTSPIDSIGVTNIEKECMSRKNHFVA